MPVTGRNVVLYENMTEIPHIILLHTFNKSGNGAAYISSVSLSIFV